MTLLQNCWELVRLAMNALESHILLWGPSGTGKTFFAMRYRVLNGQPAPISLTLTEAFPTSAAQGCYMVKGGNTVWVDGPAIRAWKTGCRLVINEITLGGPEILAFLLAILDDPQVARLTLPNGETVTPARGFQAIVTCNDDPESLPPALLDRLPVRIRIDTPHPDLVNVLPEDLRIVAVASCSAPIERRISPRAWFAFARLRQELGAEPAAAAVFANRAPEILNGLKTGSQAFK